MKLGRSVIVVLSVFILVACSSNGRQATCFDCPQENQEWDEFAFAKLEGTWRGSEESTFNSPRVKSENKPKKMIEMSFLRGERFKKAFKWDSCGEFPKQSVVLLKPVWDARVRNSKARTFEVFGKTKSNHVSYGRVQVRKINQKFVCQYNELMSAIKMNRLELPAVQISQRLTSTGRVLASGATKEEEIRFEFLNFVDEHKAMKFPKGARIPASAKEDDPPLLFRFVKTTRAIRSAYAQGKWVGTQEKIYRLWRVD